MKKPLIDQKFRLKKIPGKGGWTYADLPQVLQSSNTAFGWVKVKGTIDGVKISRYNLMPFGEGKLFLPVKAEIRKKIKKGEGDFVHVILYPDNDRLEVPEDLQACLEDEPKALEFFNSLTDREKQSHIKWIYSAKKQETRIQRLSETIKSLMKGETRVIS